MTRDDRELSLAAYGAAADGIADDTAAFMNLFADADRLQRTTVTIPPGVYYLPGKESIRLPSHCAVTAHGARFVMPGMLEDGARIVLFSGRDVVELHWSGGEFVGNCFDHLRPGNTWAPNANTRAIHISTSLGGVTEDLTFTGIKGFRVAGAVVSVEGAKATESEVDTYASRVTVQRCSFLECGKFMWDYGFLWQVITWPEEYDEATISLARRYFPPHLLHGPLRIADGDDKVYLDDADAVVRVSAGADRDSYLSFLGSSVPSNVTKGRSYYVVSTDSRGFRVSKSVGGKPLVFEGSSGDDTLCISQLGQAYYHLYAPAGAGPGKGGLDIVACQNVHVSGCTLSALGDTMHIQCCKEIVFANNQVTGSRMGAFFLAEHCFNATVTGNTVDGTNGSRVMSVERSCTDITIVGNTFRNGGRGSWMNQPQGLILANNIFINNTTKGERDPWRGRKCYETGDYGAYAELYFTTYEPGGTYGPVIVRDNIFVTGNECTDAILLQAGGHDLLVTGNVFSGATRSIRVDEGCQPPLVESNIGLERDGCSVVPALIG